MPRKQYKKETPKRKPKRTAESVGNICPYCKPTRDFTSRWHVQEHIKLSHPETRRSLIK